jgi:GntR family transcriptional regulator
VTILLRNSADSPIYEQIKRQLKDALLSGELREGDALPSIRALARELHISVITTTRAYNDLDAEGFVYSVPGKGFFVLPQNGELLREQTLGEIEEGLSAAMAGARRLGLDYPALLDMLDTLWKEESP